MIDIPSILKTANDYVEKILTISKNITANESNADTSDQAKNLAWNSTATAMKSYADLDNKVDETFMRKYHHEIQIMSEKIIDDIMTQLLDLLDKEIEGEIEFK